MVLDAELVLEEGSALDPQERRRSARVPDPAVIEDSPEWPALLKDQLARRLRESVQMNPDRPEFDRPPRPVELQDRFPTVEVSFVEAR